MAKFNLKTATEAAKTQTATESMVAGYHRVMMIQVAEIGLQRGFNETDEPKESVGFVFTNTAGQQICKTMTLVVSAYSNFNKILKTIDDVPGELSELLGHELVIEIEANGKYPKILGFYHLDDGLSDEPALSKPDELLYFTVENPQPDVLKKLHSQLRQAVAGRIRTK
ncbi:MAG: hypothetical protein QX192_11665 [Methylococcales bacterium]